MSAVDLVRARLAKHGQEHLLTFWDQLDEQGRAALLADIESIDLDGFDGAWAQSSTGEHSVNPERFAVPACLGAIEGRRARAAGEQIIREGRVAAMIVAGGQATRLGVDIPKGAFPIGPVSGASLFQIFAEGIAASNERYGARIPWYVMTSKANHDDTVAFFEKHDYFGLAPADVQFFSQAMVPVVDPEGRILLEQRHKVATSPNGHGGSLTALADTGMLADMTARGVEFISYFQVDNPLVKPVDPEFLGAHVTRGSQMSSLTMGKASDEENVGLFIEVDGKLTIVEYSDFPSEMMSLKDADGNRTYDLANIAVHVLDVAFVESLTSGDVGKALPWHRASKKVAAVDLATGAVVDPESPNAVKLELFVFDALPLAKSTMLLRTERSERFSPVKNATGVDSVVTAKRDLGRRAARWLEECGVSVPMTAAGDPDCVLEISPLYADDPLGLAEREKGSDREISVGESLLLRP